VKTILVTGAAGWIGSHVTRLLVQRGHRVLALVRPGSSVDRIADLLPLIKLIEIDLAEPSSLAGVLRVKPPDVCLHLAWYTVPGRYLHARENLDSVVSSLDLLKLLDDVGCQRTVITGTCLEYDTSMAELLSEQSPIRPGFLYSICKHALFSIAEKFQRSCGRQFAWCRIFYLYGPGEQETRLVPYVINKLLAQQPCLLTSGEQMRDYLHVVDVASALGTVALSDLEGVVNIGSGEPVRVADMALTLGRILRTEESLQLGALPMAPDDPPFVCADARRLRTHFGWEPGFDLCGGLEDTVTWWRKQSVTR
jgi:nucleoside-diphosphate-sugar epimerase